MDTAAFNALLNSLTNPATKRLDRAKIEALDATTKAAAVRYSIDKTRPVIDTFVDNSLHGELQANGYENGYRNDFFAYWVRPEHQSSFQRITPPQPTSAAKEKTKVGGQPGPRDITDKIAAKPSTAAQAIGAQILILRNDLGLTLQDVSLKTGVALANLSNIERGMGNPTIKTLDSIFKALGKRITGLIIE